MKVIIDKQTNLRMARLETMDEVISWWGFIKSGKGSYNVDVDKFFCDVIEALKDGLVVVVYSQLSAFKDPIAYYIIRDFRWFKLKSALVQKAYVTTGKVGANRAIVSQIAKWCKDKGYDRIFVFSDKASGSAFRLFEKTLGFKRYNVVFVKEI